jgi:glycerol uptake facilitator-like aquaporin
VETSGSYTSATHGIFASYPFFGTDQVTTLSLAMDQVLGTAMLLIIILAVTDNNNMNKESSLVPLTIGLGLTAIHLR